jgi:hypothetical protein
MGFLDHSSSNIIVDAVLTDVGRQFLARNDGSFSIVKFAFADDEVDYTIIEKFGRVIGKEKIEKNTPVFEAQTNAGLALKYKNVSVSNPNLVRMPNISLTAGSSSTTSNLLSMKLNSVDSTKFVTFTQQITGEPTIDVDLRDQEFMVKIPNMFLQIAGATPGYVDRDGIAYYTIVRNPTTTAAGGSIVGFTLALKSITSTQFLIYGLSTDKTIINAVGSVTGLQSGAVSDFVISISS